jgi:hypothetical protein
MVGAKIAALGEGRPKTPPIGGVKIPSTKETAKSLQVAPRRIERARKVAKEGTRELNEAVSRHEISMSTAATIAAAPAEVQREAAKDHGKNAPAIAKKIAAEKREPSTEPPIRTLGLDVPAPIMARAEHEQALVDKMSRLLADLKRTYTEYEESRGGRDGLKAGQYHASALRDATTAFGTIRGQRPACVCPSCKLMPNIQKTCASCRASGFIGETDLSHIEKILLVEGDEAGVWVSGKWHTLIALRGDDF